MDAVFRSLRWKAKYLLELSSVTLAHPGAVTAIQRSSSHLALNIHFHALVTDGVFVREPGEPAVFRELPPPSDAEVTEVAWDTCRRTRDILIRRGLWQDDDLDQARDEPPNAPEPGLAAIYQASIRGVLSLGPRYGQRVVRFYGQAARGVQDDPSSHRTGHEFDLHAKQVARDRTGLERLARYVLRAPLAQGRLELEPDGRILLQMKRSWRDGTTGMVFEPLDFLAKLTALVPYPRTNILRFHGVYAPHSALRRAVVPHREETASHACRCGTSDDPTSRSLRLSWSELLARVFAVDVFRCPRCESRMSRIAWITDRDVIRKILNSVGLAADSPAPHPPRLYEEIFGESA